VVSIELNNAVLYQRLREWRKAKAEAQGVPVYVIANNRQLLDLVRLPPRSVEALRQIRGFGKKRIARYGQELVALVAAFHDQPAAQQTS